MGQQQLLLLVLSAIIVGISIVVGINMFSSSAFQANRENVIQEAVNVGAKAQEWYRKPVVLGGGGRAFDGLTSVDLSVLGVPDTTANGFYDISDATGDTLTITATGVEVDPTTGVPLTFTIGVGPDNVGTPVFP